MITENSIEEKIALIREKKRKLFENTIGNAETQKVFKEKNLSIENIMFMLDKSF